MSIKLTTEKISNARIDILVAGDGSFDAVFNDQTYSANTKIELLQKLTVAVKKAERQGAVDVTVLGLVPNPHKRGWENGPFALGQGVVHAKLRAAHASQHRTFLLVSDDLGIATDKGKNVNFQVSGSREGTIARRLTKAEEEEYLRLREAVRVATTALEDFVGSVQINPEDALKAAQKAGTNGQ